MRIPKEISKCDWQVMMIVKDAFNQGKDYDFINEKISKEIYCNPTPFSTIQFYNVISKYFTNLTRAEEPLEYFLYFVLGKKLESNVFWNKKEEISITDITHLMVNEIRNLQIYDHYVDDTKTTMYGLYNINGVNQRSEK